MEIKRTTFKQQGNEPQLSVILSDWSTETREEYATHIVDNNGKFWGHYLPTREEAEQDFAERVQLKQRRGYVIHTMWCIDDDDVNEEVPND